MKNMENFSINSAKSFLGKHVNLHLKDGSVIVNVHLKSIQKGGTLGKGNQVTYSPYGNQKLSRMPLRSVAWAELLNPNLMRVSG